MFRKRTSFMILVILFIFSLAFSYWSEESVLRIFSNRKLNSRLSSCNNCSNSIPSCCSYANRFKKCFYICRNVSIKCDFLKYLHYKYNSMECCELQQNFSVINRNETIDEQIKCRRFVTLNTYRGGIGNQMFAVASLLGIAYKYDRIPIIPFGTILSKYFDLSNQVAISSIRLSQAIKYDFDKSSQIHKSFSEINSENGNISIAGYLHSWKYFDSIKYLIKNVFKFKKVHLDNSKSYLSSVSIDNFATVCIHIRRGDHISKSRLLEGYAIPDMIFFEKVRLFYLNRFSRVQFIAISDDKRWCAHNLNFVNVSRLKSPGDELALLSLCDHVVITLGTFGWWGAYLSGGTIVYFDGYPVKDSPIASKFIKDNFYPQDWIGMS